MAGLYVSAVVGGDVYECPRMHDTPSRCLTRRGAPVLVFVPRWLSVTDASRYSSCVAV